MRRVAAAVTTFAMVMATASLFAQAKPNFAGTWVREMPAAGAPPAGGGGGGGRGGGGGGGVWGAEPTITQTATELSVTYTTGREGAAPVKMTFKLDGTDSVNQVMGRGGEAAPQTSKAVWTGDKLVITTTLANGTRTQTVSLVGGKLTLETNAPGREGAPVTTTATYTKKA